MKEELRAGKIMSDYCKCGHLKNDHQPEDNSIHCSKCVCVINYDNLE